MSPRIPTAAGEQIETRPEIGTPEYVRMQGLYDATVERVAKLRHMETRLPEAIADAEQRMRDFAVRLQLPSATAPVGVKRERRAAPGVTRARVLDALPGRPVDLATSLNISRGAVDSAIAQLRKSGVIEKDGDQWRAVEGDEKEAAA